MLDISVLIVIIPIALFSILFEKKKMKNNIKNREYTYFSEFKQYTPPYNINPFLAGYLLDDSINYSDMTVILYDLLKKGILNVVEIGKKDFDKDFVFIFQKNLDEIYKEVDIFEKIMVDELWFRDTSYSKEEIYKNYPHLEILYPVCRVSHIKIPKKILKRNAKSEFQKMGILDLKPNLNIKNILFYLLITILLYFFAGSLKPSFYSILFAIGYLYYWKYIKIHLNEKGVILKSKLESFKNYLAFTKKDKFKTIRTLETLKNEEYHIKYFSYMLAFKIVSHNIYTSGMNIDSVWYDERKLSFEQDIQRIFKKLRQK